MKGMVDSFNVSVAAGILMHHAVCDRTSRLVMNTDLHFVAQESRTIFCLVLLILFCSFSTDSACALILFFKI